MKRPDRITVDQIAEIANRVADKFPIAFFSPNRGQVPFLASRAKTQYLSGANQSGKTTILLVKMLTWALGFVPWLSPWDEGYYAPLEEVQKPPNLGRLIGKDWKHWLPETALPKIKELVPEDFIHFEKDGQGNEAIWKFPGGAQWILFTHKTERLAFESGTIDYAGADEPCPRYAHTGTVRGLLRKLGPFAMSGTPVTQPWVFDEIYLKAKTIYMSGEVLEVRPRGDPDIEVFIVRMEDNLEEHGGGLTQASIEYWEKQIPKSQRQARLYGLHPQIGGRAFQQWEDEAPWVIPEFRAPHNGYGLYMGIDPHPRKPTYVCWLWLTPQEHAFLVGELYDEELKKISQVCKKIHDFHRAFGCGPTVAVMDGKMGQQVSQSSGLTILQEYSKNGVVCRPSTAKPAARVMLLEEWLDRLHGIPRLQMFERCARARDEFRHARWKRSEDMLADEKDDREELDKRWDDAITTIGHILAQNPSGQMPSSMYEQDEDEEETLMASIKDPCDGSWTGY